MVMFFKNVDSQWLSSRKIRERELKKMRRKAHSERTQYPPCRTAYMKNKECEYGSTGSPERSPSKKQLLLYFERLSGPYSLVPYLNRKASTRTGQDLR